MKILFLVPYPLGESPSQRFRFEQYFEHLRKHGVTYRVQSFLDSHNWRIFFKPGNGLAKAFILLNGFAKRISLLLVAARFDFVFIHREATPVGPPVFEWIMAKVLRRRIVYDFDDAIWMTDRGHESFFLRAAKWRSKVRKICTWSYVVSCGNLFLCDYARRFNDQVVLNPTTIDVSYHRAQHPSSHGPTVVAGWTGTHSTLKYLLEIEDSLLQLQRRHPHIEIRVIADKAPAFTKLKARFVVWNAETEIEDLSRFDIGIMPLPDDEWSKGKCGFKALQYMALGIPTVASAVGANVEIIEHGRNGLLVKPGDSWVEPVAMLAAHEAQRRELGAMGQKTVNERYSVESNVANFLSLFA